jgi:hypothetical protein
MQPEPKNTTTFAVNSGNAFKMTLDSKASRVDGWLEYSKKIHAISDVTDIANIHSLST